MSKGALTLINVRHLNLQLSSWPVLLSVTSETSSHQVVSIVKHSAAVRDQRVVRSTASHDHMLHWYSWNMSIKNIEILIRYHLTTFTHEVLCTVLVMMSINHNSLQ